MAFSFRKLYSDPSRVGLIEVGDSDSNWGDDVSQSRLGLRRRNFLSPATDRSEGCGRVEPEG
jgi:hypothetical protein